MTETDAQEAVLGVILVTHADYGASLLRAAEFILGTQEQCETVSVTAARRLTIS